MTETTSDPIGSLVFALMIVGVAIGLFAVIAFFLKKKFNLAALGQKLNAGSRLSVVETIAVDQKRKLVLIQKDGTEHLVLVGGPTDLVIETSEASSIPQTQTEMPASVPAAAAAPAPTTEEEAIDFFDKARDRIFVQQETQAPAEPKPAKPMVRDDTDDFQAVLQSQQNAQRAQPLEPIPETAEERVNKLKALLDEAQKSRLNKS
ncbi:MAG: FliO/MopB family protein [Rhizobiaceae bacterium]|nr:FliO/MopB family protein [Rhizobiaceae bacterium]